MIRLPDNICIYDDVVSKEWCDEVIAVFDKKCEAALEKYSGKGDDDIDGVWIRDSEKRFDMAIGANQYQSLEHHCAELRKILRETLVEYHLEISGLNYPIAEDIEALDIKLQRTPPGGGFCKTHYEQGNCENTARRFAVWILYLNDLPEECGTDFPNQNAVVTPKAGRLAIWPAGYTHPHGCLRGVTEMKYIATGWFLYHCGKYPREIEDGGSIPVDRY